MSLFEYARYGDGTGLQQLIIYRPDIINAVDENGLTLLSTATWYGHLPLVHMLLDYGADATIADAAGVTSLLWSILKGRDDIAKLLILRGSSAINIQDLNGYNPLILASREGRTEIVQLLLDHNANLNAQCKDGHTALLWAIEIGHNDIARRLIEHNASKFIKNNNGDTALIRACDLGNVDIVTAILDAAWTDLDVQGNRGDIALIRASAKGHCKIVSMLLHKGAAIDIRNNGGLTALDVAHSNEIVTAIAESNREKILSKQSNSFTLDNTATYPCVFDTTQALNDTIRELEVSKLEISRLQGDILTLTEPLAVLESWKLQCQIAKNEAIELRMQIDSYKSRYALKDHEIELAKCEYIYMKSDMESIVIRLEKSENEVKSLQIDSIRTNELIQENIVTIQSLESSLIEKDNVIVKYNDEIEHLKVELESNNLIDELTEIKKELNSYKIKYNELEKIIVNMETEASVLRNDLNISTKTLKTTEQQLTLSDTERDQLHKDLKNAKSRLIETEETLHKWKEDMSILKVENDNARGTFTLMQEQLESSLRSEISFLQVEVEKLTAEALKAVKQGEGWKVSLETVTEDLVQAQTKVTALESILAESELVLERLNNQLNEATEANVVKDKEIEGLKMELVTLKNEIHTQSEEYEASQGQLAQLRVLLAETRKLREEDQIILSETREDLSRMVQEVDEAMTKVMHGEVIVSSSKEEIERLRNEQAQLQIEYGKAIGKVTEFESRKEEMIALYNKEVNIEVQALKTELSESKFYIESFESELTAYQNSLEKTKQELSLSNSEILRLKEQYKNDATENKSSSNNSVSIEEVANLRLELMQLKSRLQDGYSSGEHWKSEVERLRDELAKAVVNYKKKAHELEA
eukprot:gene2291-4457_t